jgi:hypothetical protein
VGCEGEIRNRDFEIWGAKGKFGIEISKCGVRRGLLESRFQNVGVRQGNS